MAFLPEVRRLLADELGDAAAEKAVIIIRDHFQGSEVRVGRMIQTFSERDEAIKRAVERKVPVHILAKRYCLSARRIEQIKKQIQK